MRPERLALFGYAHVPWMKAHQRLIDEGALPGAAERLAQSEAAADRLVKAGYVRIGLVPSTTREREAYIDEAGLARLRKIRRLSEDVGLNTVGIEVVMRLLDQIDDLQRQIDRQRRP